MAKPSDREEIASTPRRDGDVARLGAAVASPGFDDPSSLGPAPGAGRAPGYAGGAGSLVGGGGPRPDPGPVVRVRAGVGRPAFDWREIGLHRDLMMTLAWRDVRVRYKQTVVGLLWVVLQPLLAALIFTFVFGMVARMPGGGRPYLLVAFSGLLAWNAFSGVVLRSSFALVSNAHLVTKVYFPREVLPLSTVVSTLIDFAVGLGVVIALAAWYGIRPGPGLLLVPVWLALLILPALGVGLMAGALMVRYRDIQHIVPVLLTLGLYGSPVAWPASAVPERYHLACALNPLVGAIESFRWSLLREGTLDGPALAYGATMGVVIFWAGAATFRRAERRFADVL